MKRVGIILRRWYLWWFDDSYRLEIMQARSVQRRFKKAKILADERHKMDGRTYYVILGGNNKYYVYNSFQIKDAQKNGLFWKAMTIMDIYTAASYIATGNADLKKESE